mmetsp:Transcript_15926/g.24120  ORF Transcript_15926/g.24120 Transcript_15926/m.24120 type:complete len:194 (+) Transcript_15926:240-821(+)|eukprot:CAMPEP_0178897002 /NCGR_PEP_ID=MMETSP0786-20121207/1501_1 /TAXON_ID=186022 /ORGANISM="Thalassionema frauenfeldii, Strain CCMP 1798" /LENGTH=193 /DNA_ID=CAMNT_0020567497 /DNA_START=188 /DNA_END=769 /DNA_ORIENTATION=-
MPRFFDDYSNTYLTHDSSAGRKQQRRGWKFRENFKLHYQKYLDEWRSGPMGLASAQQGFIRSRPPEDPTIPPLPEGWKEELDEATNISFYVHGPSGRRTWVRPGFRPPPGGAAQGRPPANYSGPPPNFQKPPPQNMSQPSGNFQRPPPPFQQGPPPPFQQNAPQGAPPPPFATPGGQQVPPPPFKDLPPPPNM